MNCDKFVLELA